MEPIAQQQVPDDSGTPNTAVNVPPQLKTLVAAHLDLVYSAALRQVHDPHLAEDVTQNVFLIAAQNARKIPPARAAAWLITVTRYAALTLLRAQRRRRRHERSAAMRLEATQTAVPINDFESHLDEAITSLGQTDRQLIILRYFNDYSVTQVAAALGIADNAASKRIERAIKKLGDRLRRRGVHVPGEALGSAIVATAIRPAPKALGGQILSASAGAAAAVSAPAIGLLLMTVSAKLQLAMVAGIVALVVGGAYTAVRWSAAGPPPRQAPIMPVADDPAGMTTLIGTVVDSAGRGVPNALVSQGDVPLGKGYYTTHTDASGNFVLSHIPLGQALVLVARAPGLAPELMKGVVTARPSPFTFALKPAVTLRARIVDARGVPIVGLPLDLYYWRGSQALRVFGTSLQDFPGPRTDGNGMVTIPDMPSDAVTIEPITPDNLLRARFDLVASDQIPTITIRDAIPVSIAVVDSQTGEPIPAFTVVLGGNRISMPGYWNDAHPITGKNGACQIVLKTSEKYHFFRVQAPGYDPVMEKCTEDQNAVSLTFHLARSSHSTLVVLAPGGEPLAKATVYVIPSEQSLSLQNSEFFRDGRFAFGGGQTLLKTDAAGKLAVNDPHDPATRVVVANSAGFADVLLSDALKGPMQLDPYARVEGVAMIGSRPATGETITLDYLTVYRAASIKTSR